MNARDYFCCLEDGGAAGPFSWDRKPDGHWDVWVQIPNVLPNHMGMGFQTGFQYRYVAGVAADDGFGNLVLIGGLS